MVSIQRDRGLDPTSYVLLQHPMIKQFFCNTSLTGCISIDVSLVRRDTTILLNAFSYRRKVRSRLPSRLFLPTPLLRASARARQKEMGQRIASLCEYELRPVLHLRNLIRIQILFPNVSMFAKKTSKRFGFGSVIKVMEGNFGVSDQSRKSQKSGIRYLKSISGGMHSKDIIH